MSTKDSVVKRNPAKKLTTEEEDKLLEKLYYNYGDDDDSTDDEMPYGGKIMLARKKKGDSWACVALQVFLVLGVLGVGYYAYYYYEHMHVSVVHGYAHLGFEAAQHDLGNRYLHGVGVEKHTGKAMEWFKKAADQGHPHASYNLAVGQLKGMHEHIDDDEATRLIKHAANNDVPEAKKTLENICYSGGC